jgi:hypothetical protein
MGAIVPYIGSPLPLTKENADAIMRKCECPKVKGYYFANHIPQKFFDMIVFSSPDYERANKFYEENPDTIVFIINQGELVDESKLRYKVCGWDYLTEYIKIQVEKQRGKNEGKSKDSDNEIPSETSGEQER